MTPIVAELGRRFGNLLMLVASTPPADPLGPVSADPDAVRDAACRLVESTDACRPPPPPPTFDPSSSGGGSSSAGAGGSLLGALLWVLLVAVVVGLVVVAIRYVAERRGRPPGLVDERFVSDSDSPVGSVVIDRAREPDGWRQEADEHRAHGRWRDALRCRYRALVGDLARRGLIDEIPGRTTGEERRQMRAMAPNAMPFFREAADLFDAAWYGNASTSEAEDDRFIRLDAEVLAHAPAVTHRVPRLRAGDEVPR